MGRPMRVDLGGYVYHVLNRGNGRTPIFRKDRDYEAFLRIASEALEHVPGMRLLSYCLMPNHWHLVLWPRADGQLSDCLHWLTLTHTQRWHAHYRDIGGGHLDQGRYKSFPIAKDDHYLAVCRYVERNALRAGLVACSFQQLHLCHKGGTIMAKDRPSEERIAYRGRVFLIQWYCDDTGYSQPREFAEALDDSEKRKLAVLLSALGDLGKIHNKQRFRYEGDQIYAFKPKPHRFLSFFFEGGK